MRTIFFLAFAITAVPVFAGADAAGSGWVVVPSPNPAPQDILQAVSGTSASDVWAVGVRFGEQARELTLAEHWDGNVWTEVPIPSPGNQSNSCTLLYQNDLTAVAAIAPDDAWAVGQYCILAQPEGSEIRALIEHWDGTRWNLVASPNPSPFSSLFGIAAVAANDIWVVGQTSVGARGVPVTLIEHWDGTAWSVVPSPNPAGRTAYLAAVAAVSANDIWAVGYSAANGKDIPLIEHYDGNTWSIVPAPYVQTSPFNELHAITVIAPDDIWAVGYENYDGTHRGQTGLFEHWDGTAWSLVSAPPIGINGETVIWAVTSLAANDVWAFGSTWNRRLDMVPLIEHWNGEAWSVVPAPDPGGAAQYFGATSVQGHMWAVGDYAVQPGGFLVNPLTLVITQ